MIQLRIILNYKNNWGSEISNTKISSSTDDYKFPDLFFILNAAWVIFNLHFIQIKIMKQNNTQFLQGLYLNLGKLFYAIAASDKIIKKQEVEKLREIVDAEWLKFEDSEDEFGTDMAFEIEAVFDFLQEKNADAETAFNDFREFKTTNKENFSQNLKNLIWVTADSIASSFSNKNKSELLMLSRLKKVLDE